ncbi:hypothetical protein BGZ60DRAFT_347925, partial [Tricladium varicosporioides]
TTTIEPEYVTFFAGGNKGKRLILSGSQLKPTFSSIPKIDFARALSSSATPATRREIALEVRRNFTEVGFFYAANHGISAELQDNVLRVMKEFFALPTEEKMKIHINKSPYIRGYEALLETKLDVKTRGDLKEAINIADDPSEPEQNAPVDLDRTPYPDGPMNQWPSKPSDFREVICEYREACLNFSKDLLKLIAISLDLEEDHFSKLTSFPMAGLRPLHYPPQEMMADVGIGAHADYSWFTLVNQLTPVPALEVLNHNGHWISAPPIPNTLVVNVGDFLERATNDLFQSTVHRVVNRSPDQERYSIPYFFSPSHDAMIETIETCVSEERPLQYGLLKAGDWQKKRLLSARYK